MSVPERTAFVSPAADLPASFDGLRRFSLVQFDQDKVRIGQLVRFQVSCFQENGRSPVYYFFNAPKVILLKMQVAPSQEHSGQSAHAV